MSEQTTHKQFNDPVSVAKRSNQKVYLAASGDKAAMLAHLLKGGSFARSVVITKTKRDADALEAYLAPMAIKAAALHGNKSDEERTALAKAFTAGELDILITTDMVLQALGLKDLAYVISYDLPGEPEHYLMRLGCMGTEGQALALMSPEENSLLYAVERSMKRAIPQEKLEGFVPESTEKPEAQQQRAARKEKPRHRVERRKTGSKPHGKKPAEGERKPYGKKPAEGDRRPRKKQEGEQKAYGKKTAEGDRKSYGKKPEERDRKPRDKKEGDRKAYGKKPAAKAKAPKRTGRTFKIDKMPGSDK